MFGVRQLGLSGKLWPMHLKPKEDELLSSWLVRLATAHGLRVQSFCHAVWPQRRLWWQDTDLINDHGMLQVLAERTNTSLDRTSDTTLTTYEGRLFAERTRNGIYAWILPLGVQGYREQMFGLQFCPWCLAADVEPYFRRRWRLGFNVICPEHLSMLMDRCLHCGASIKLHKKITPTERHNAPPIEVTQCHHCLHDLRDFATEQYRREVDLEEIEFQNFLIEASEQGWVEVPSHGYIYSHLFFAGLYQISAIVIGNRKSKRIQESLVQHFDLKRFIPTASKSNQTFRRLDVAGRRGVLEACQRLLGNWPDNFIEFCRSNSLLSGELVLSDIELPYWYFKVIREYLTSPRYTYVVTDQEFESVLNYLRVKQVKPTFGDLCKYLPNNAVYAFMKRKNLIGKPFLIDTCPRCQTIALQRRAGHCRNGEPRFKCKACNQRHPEDTELHKPHPKIQKKAGVSHKHSPEVRQRAISLYLEGNSFRKVGRIMSIQRDTIRRWYKKYRQNCEHV